MQDQKPSHPEEETEDVGDLARREQDDRDDRLEDTHNEWINSFGD